MRMMVVCLATFTFVSCTQRIAPPVDVEKAIERAQGFLLSQQDDAGGWVADGQGTDAPTAMAVWALIESGHSPQHPQISKALAWLETHRGEHKTTAALRCLVWGAACRRDRNKYMRGLRKDIRDTYRYVSTGRKVFQSNVYCRTPWVVQALAAADRVPIEIPSLAWRKTLEQVVHRQRADGGWSHTADGASAAASTAAGVYAAQTCRRVVAMGEYFRVGMDPRFPPIERGREWLVGGLGDDPARRLRGRSDLPVLLFWLQQAALATGRWNIGKEDLYEVGSAALLKAQRADGSWVGECPVLATALALRFLVLGRRPVLLAHLQYDGDWNNRPDAMASLTAWLRRAWPCWPFNSQIVNIRTPLTAWPPARILFITGGAEPMFSDDDLQKLRRFVLRGGTIFSCTEGNGAGFANGIRGVYRRLFPDCSLQACGAKHVIYSKKVWRDLRGRPQLHELSNGVRPLAVHTDEDLPMSWQLRRTVTRRWAFQAIVNAVIYSVDTPWALPPHRAARWPEEPKEPPRRTLTLTRLKHAGPHDPEPLAYERFARKMAAEAKLTVKVVGPTDIKALKTTGAAVATLTGTGTLKLAEDESAALNQFVTAGGTLVVDAAGGNEAFADSAEDVLKKMFGQSKLPILPRHSPLYRMPGMAIGTVKYRLRTRLRLGGRTRPNLRGLVLGKRVGVIFSREDITAGLVGYSSFTVDGYAPESAFAIMRNIVLEAARRGGR